MKNIEKNQNKKEKLEKCVKIEIYMKYFCKKLKEKIVNLYCG